MSSKARNADQARQRYVGYLQKSLACVSKAIWLYGPAPGADDPQLQSLFVSQDPLKLSSARGALYLRAAQLFKTYRDVERGEWRCKTERYSYNLMAPPRARAEPIEVVIWDWHPPEPLHPHIHVRASHAGLGTLRKFHFPSGRVLFEDVLLFLIDEFGVRAIGGKGKAERTLTEVSTRVRDVWSWS